MSLIDRSRCRESVGCDLSSKSLKFYHFTCEFHDATAFSWRRNDRRFSIVDSQTLNRYLSHVLTLKAFIFVLVCAILIVFFWTTSHVWQQKLHTIFLALAMSDTGREKTQKNWCLREKSKNFKHLKNSECSSADIQRKFDLSLWWKPWNEGCDRTTDYFLWYYFIL